MLIAERLRTLREAKNLSAEEVEGRAGLECWYLCDVGRGKVVPPLSVWEKIALALEIPLAKLFYDGEGLPPCQIFPVGRPLTTSLVYAKGLKKAGRNHCRRAIIRGSSGRLRKEVKDGLAMPKLQ